MEFNLNGKRINYNGDPDLSLLSYLRREVHIHSAKDGCSAQGACGACTVQIDDKAALSCKTKMKQLKGKKVVTTEGLAQEIQETFARAFAEQGGVQCGFCTPGIVMRARVLLEANRNPSREEIKRMLNKHVCRCTGYIKIVDAIMLAAARLRDEQASSKADYSGAIGSRLPKYQAFITALGQRPFVCDIEIDNLKYAALKLSDHPRAKIISLDTSVASKMAGVIRVVTAKDIPGSRQIGIIISDWPAMVDIGEETRYIGDVICGVIAESEEIARAAVNEIKVKYEVLEPICDPESALQPSAAKIHASGNLLSETIIKRGDAKKALAQSAFVARGTYRTQRIEHAFLEIECCIAEPKIFPNGTGIQVWSQSQGVYEDRKQIARLLNLPLERVNVIQVSNGGGFGGKEDLLIQGQTALFSYLSNVPVKLQLTREESMRMHPKRHPLKMNYAVGCDKNGKLTALIADIVGDSGAYASVGMKVLERAAGHACGAYAIPIVDICAKAVYTDNVPCGAMRGFGVNQVVFAVERSIDELCELGKFDRWQFRFDNALKNGDRIATGQVLKEAVGLRETLLAVKDAFAKAKYAGIACGIKNCGVGNGMPDASQAKIEIKSHDKIILHHGWTEMGQGVHTMAIQTFCQETGIDPAIVEVKVATCNETVCGMTTSSRGTSLIGNSMRVACQKLKKDLAQGRTLNDLVGREYFGEWVCDWTTKPGKEKPGQEPVTHYSYSYATQVVIMNESGKIEKVVAAHDAGRIMNPTLFEGQIEGAIHMGLGYALSEDFPMENGWPLVTKYSQCGLVRAQDMPEVEVIGIEVTDPHGPYGAKGVGEIGMVPTAAAVANAFALVQKKKVYALPLARSPRSLLRKDDND